MNKYSDIVSDGGMDPRNEYEKEKEIENFVKGMRPMTADEAESLDEFFWNDLKENKIMNEAAQKIKNLIDIQKLNGNYNYDEYMYGMLIGLECAYYTVLEEKAKFTERPEKWLEDNIPKDFVPEVAEGFLDTSS